MPLYNVKSPIKYKGERIEPGKSVELADKIAQPLLELGAIEPAPKAEPEKKGK